MIIVDEITIIDEIILWTVLIVNGLILIYSLWRFRK